ncbi:RNA-splicing factor [Coemansia sp. RSA 2702]|nr:RNA-splicing factor [Coemansia sp. RSA 2702]
MGSGDLNMKKSWHPQTLANQRRVAEAKLKAEEEAQRASKLQKELREERQREEMERLNATVTKKTINKLDWMYNAPAAGVPQNSDDLEAYLLGKKDAKDLISQKTASEVVKPDDKWKDGLFAFSNRNANNERDTMAKSMEDPLAEIKRREQAAAMQVMASRAKDKSRDGKCSNRGEKKDKDRHRSKHRSRRHRDESEPGSAKRSESQEAHRSRKHRDHDRSRSHRRRSRSPEPHKRSQRSRSPY